MKIPRRIRWIVIGAILMLMGIANIWFGSIRTEELRPLAEAHHSPLARVNEAHLSAGISTSSTVNALRPVAAYEFYRVVTNGGKILCAFGALLLIVGVTLRGLVESTKKIS